MSQTMTSITTWRERNGRRPLVEVAREQADRLRVIHGEAPRTLRVAQERRDAARARAQAAVGDRTGAHRSVTAATPVEDRRTLYAEADRLAAQLPVGRYALPRKQATKDGNDITFFEVVEFKRGPKAGTRRIFQIVSNGVGLTQLPPMPPMHQIYAIRHILEDVAAAAGLFGRTLEICAFGPHPLTNARSRAAGYGETCAKNHGLPW